MDQPANSQPPDLPPSPPPLPTPAPPAPASPASQGSGKKSPLPWILGGCGCLTLLLTAITFLVVVTYYFGNVGSAIKKSSTNFNPYKGSLDGLLLTDLSGTLVKFKLAGKVDRTGEWKANGATEAIGFTYNQEGAGVIIPVDGVLVNFPTADQAVTALKSSAAQQKATLSRKEKGQRFATTDGAIVGWTDGSVLCIVSSKFARPAGNFEQAAPF